MCPFLAPCHKRCETALIQFTYLVPPYPRLDLPSAFFMAGSVGRTRSYPEVPDGSVGVRLVGVPFFDAVPSVGDAFSRVPQIQDVTRVAVGAEQRLFPGRGRVEMRSRARLHWGDEEEEEVRGKDNAAGERETYVNNRMVDPRRGKWRR